MDATDIADTIEYLDNFAEGLELETEKLALGAEFGHPSKANSMREAAQKMREAITLLEPFSIPSLAHGGPADD